jgi:hypothetical protein
LRIPASSLPAKPAANPPETLDRWLVKAFSANDSKHWKRSLFLQMKTPVQGYKGTWHHRKDKVIF